MPRARRPIARAPMLCSPFATCRCATVPRHPPFPFPSPRVLPLFIRPVQRCPCVCAPTHSHLLSLSLSVLCFVLLCVVCCVLRVLSFQSIAAVASLLPTSTGVVTHCVGLADGRVYDTAEAEGAAARGLRLDSSRAFDRCLGGSCAGLRELWTLEKV